MKALIAALILFLLSGSAFGQVRNEIGIYTVAEPSPGIDPAETRYDGPIGAVDLYVVVLNPYNEKTGRPIANLSGFEFRIELTSRNAMIAQADMRGGVNAMPPPDYYCGTNLPVVNGMATLLEVTVGVFVLEPFVAYLQPVSNGPAQSVPGGLAIADADDNHHLVQAYPSSGDLANPVFGFWTGVVSARDETWGNLKSLYR